MICHLSRLHAHAVPGLGMMLSWDHSNLPPLLLQGHHALRRKPPCRSSTWPAHFSTCLFDPSFTTCRTDHFKVQIPRFPMAIRIQSILTKLACEPVSTSVNGAAPAGLRWAPCSPCGPTGHGLRPGIRPTLPPESSCSRLTSSALSDLPGNSHFASETSHV